MAASRNSLFENTLFGVFIALALTLSFAWYAKRHNNFKVQQMMVEQTALRQGVRLYYAKLGSFPPDLKKVVAILNDLGWKWKFTKNPFGEEYRYDPKTGWVN